MKNKIKILRVIFLGILIFLVLNSVSADIITNPTGNEIIPMQRGEPKGILMDPDRMYTEYYVADGRTASFYYSQALMSYLFGKKGNGNFLVPISIYYATWFDKNYTLVKNANIEVLSQRTDLTKTSGVYKFQFKCYACDWAAVNLKIK